MRKIYYLSTCDTCKKILAKINPSSHGFELQDIKNEKLTSSQLSQMKKLSGSYEKLFSKRAMLYTSMKLKEKKLSEHEMRDLILEEYTFLKRPVIIFDERIFIGNAPKEIETLMNLL